MKRLLLLMVASLAVAATPARAQQCGSSPHCLCLEVATRAGTGSVEAIDGATTTLRIESASVGLDAGMVLAVPRGPDETVGTRWLVINDTRRLVDDAGTIGCYGSSTPRIPVELAERAVGSESSCYDLAEPLTGPPCPRASCSVSPGLALTAILAWLVRRKTRC